MPLIKKAFRKFDTAQGPYMPKLTIVVCGKRHHTRFFPTEPQNAANDGNPKPGTVVDRGITAVYEFDFFLQGQSSHHFPRGGVLTLLPHSARRPAGHHEADALLCRPRRDRVHRGPAADADE